MEFITIDILFGGNVVYIKSESNSGDGDLNAIIAPLGNQYYSYWDDRPTYDVE